MKNSRKILVLIPAAMAFTLAGCTSSSDTTTDTNTGTTPTSSTPSTEKQGHFDHPVEIEFKSTLSYTDQIQTLIDDFNELEPNVTVTYTKVSGNYSTLKTNIIEAIGANALPNIVSCYPDHVAEYLDYGIAVNLEKYMNSSEDYAWTEDDYNDILPSLLNQCNSFAVNGTYMLPHSSSTEGMFYDSRILGLTFEGCNDGNPITDEYLNNITWEELMEKLAPALLKYNADHENIFFAANAENPSEEKGAIVAYSGSDNAFVTLCEEKGVEFSRINKSTGSGEITFNETSTMRDTMKQFNKYYKSNLFTTATLENETNLNVNEKHYSIFATGSTGGLKYQIPTDNSFVTNVMRIPNFEGQPHKVISQGPGVCVLKSGDEDKDLASYLFIDYINQTENTLYWALETGYFPVRQSAFESDAYIDACAAGTKTGIDLLKAKTYSYAGTIQEDFFTNAPFKGSDSARSLAGSLLNECVGYAEELTDDILNSKFETAINEIKKKM